MEMSVKSCFSSGRWQYHPPRGKIWKDGADTTHEGSWSKLKEKESGNVVQRSLKRYKCTQTITCNFFSKAWPRTDILLVISNV